MTEIIGGADAVSDAPAPTPSRPLWRNTDYQLLMTGRTLAVIGAAMTGLATMLLAYDLTRNTATASVVTSFGLIGMLVTSLPAGALVDRWDRRRVMAVASFLQAAFLASVPVALALGGLSVWQLGLVSFVGGAASTFYGPAETASLKRIVAADQLGTAMSVNQARGALGSVVGPPLSGALYAVSRAFPFVIDAVACVVAGVLAGCVRRDLRPASDEVEPARSLRGDVVAGIRYVAGRRALLPFGLFACLLNFGFALLMTVLVLDLQRRGTAPALIGLIETVAGAASLVGAFASAPLLRVLPVGRLTVVVTAAMLAASVGMTLLPAYHWVLVLLGSLCLLMPAVNAGLMAYFTSQVHDRMMGRASAALGLVSMGMMPLGNVLGGVLLQQLGRWQGMTPGLVVIACCLGLSFLPVIRDVPRTSEFVPVEELEARQAGAEVRAG